MIKLHNYDTLDGILKQKIDSEVSFVPCEYKQRIINRQNKTIDKNIITMIAFEHQLLSLYDNYKQCKASKAEEKFIKEDVYSNVLNLKSALPLLDEKYDDLKCVLSYYTGVFLETKGYIPKWKILKFVRMLIIMLDFEITHAFISSGNEKYVW